MKKIIFILAMVLLPALASAQTAEFKKFYKTYDTKNNYSTLQMSGDMFVSSRIFLAVGLPTPKIYVRPISTFLLFGMSTPATRATTRLLSLVFAYGEGYRILHEPRPCV
jgi:hypothetical protein